MRVLAFLWRAVRAVLLALAALVVFIEEFGWRPLAEALGRLARWKPIRRLEDRIRRLPARLALLLFVVPAVLLFPIKLAALGLIQAGHAATGVAVIVGAKVLGTAILGRLFVLLETQLRTFAWFVRALDWWQLVKARVAEALARSRLWRALRTARRRFRDWRRQRTQAARTRRAP